MAYLNGKHIPFIFYNNGKGGEGGGNVKAQIVNGVLYLKQTGDTYTAEVKDETLYIE